MAFQLSPGVNVTEVDLTTIIPAISTTIGAVAGAFQWGPLNQAVLLENEDQIVDRFGEPDNETAISFFTAANFLAYGNQLRLVRVADETIAMNSTANAAGLLIKNDEDYEQNYAAGQASIGNWAGKYAGELANGIQVSICPSADAFSQSLATVNTTAASLFTDSIVDLEDRIEVGTVIRDSAGSGEERSVTAITAGTSEALVTAGTAVTGVATTFLTTLSVGMMLESAGERRWVTAVTDDLNATINAPFTTDIVAAIAVPTLAVTISSAFTVDLAAATVDANWKYKSTLGIAPGTSPYVSERAGSNDEMHIVVVDANGTITGVRGNILEIFSFVSLASDAKSEDGSSNYYADVVNSSSQYIRWMDHQPSGLNWGSLAASTAFTSLTTSVTDTLAGGVDGNTISDADKIRGYDLFANAEELDVSLVLGADASSAVASHIIQNVCEARNDCIGIISPERADVVQNTGAEADDIVAFRNTLPSSSYGVMDSGWKKQFDKYNDVNRFVPLNGDTAGLMVRTDNVNDPWFSPAGLNRGRILNIKELAFVPNKAERDLLYTNSVNPVVTFAGQGTVLFGDKTMLSRPSAFDRINVRRLFIVLEKAIATAAKFTLFEFNDEFTRQTFRNLVEPFLRDIQGRRGITDFRVVADTTNNTAEVIDGNRFVGDIYIKPARSINFIQLNFVAVRSDVEFSEIVGRF